VGLGKNNQQRITHREDHKDQSSLISLKEGLPAQNSEERERSVFPCAERSENAKPQAQAARVVDAQLRGCRTKS